MDWFVNLPLRGKLLLTFGIIVLLQFGVMLEAYLLIAKNSRIIAEFNAGIFDEAIKLKDLRSNQNAMRADLLEVLSTRDAGEFESATDDIKSREAESRVQLADLMQRAADDPRRAGLLNELKDLRGMFSTTRDEILDLAGGGREAQARALAMGVQHQRNRRMREITDELVAMAERAGEEVVAAANIASDRALALFLVWGLISLALSLTFVLSLDRVITRPLGGLVRVAELVASGDLRVAPDTAQEKRRDEVGRLGGAFRSMVQNLAVFAGESRDIANALASATTQIRDSMNELAASTSETSASLGETVATISEVRQGSDMVSEKAQAVAASTGSARDIAGRGLTATRDVIAGMEGIGEQVGSIAESVARLGDQSVAIGEIIATVADLAEQSNLLAVNAAIEAARAGEQGRGFGVVAQEIRALAEQSREATAQVRTILTDVQKSMSAAVMLAEQGTRAVETGREQSTAAGRAIEELDRAVEGASDAAIQIAAATREQITGMNQIEQAMQSIKQATEQNMAATRQTEAAANEVNELGQNVRNTLERFHV